MCVCVRARGGGVNLRCGGVEGVRLPLKLFATSLALRERERDREREEREREGGREEEAERM